MSDSIEKIVAEMRERLDESYRNYEATAQSGDENGQRIRRAQIEVYKCVIDRIGSLRQVPEVCIDFEPSSYYAGPFPVVDGRVSLPAVTLKEAMNYVNHAPPTSGECTTAATNSEIDRAHYAVGFTGTPGTGRFG